LHHVGVTAAFTTAVRKQLVTELAPLRERALDAHPWRDWAEADAEAQGQRMPGGTSRWNRGKDLSWEPLRPERVCEVAYDHMQGTRFRHAAQFLRWRPDKRPQDCRYDQLDVTPAYELERVFGARRPSDAAQGS
jgi:ATP-dependent DNA ligase